MKKIFIYIVLFLLTVIGFLVFYNNRLLIVKFDYNDGSIIEEVKVKYQEYLDAPDIPKKDGYAFVNWEYRGKKFDFSTPINKNMTLVANWVKADYYIRVTFIDEYSPDRYLEVYHENEILKIKELRYIDDVKLVTLYKDDKIVVSNADIMDEDSLKIVLDDNKEEIALLIR